MKMSTIPPKSSQEYEVKSRFSNSVNPVVYAQIFSSICSRSEPDNKTPLGHSVHNTSDHACTYSCSVDWSHFLKKAGPNCFWTI